MDNLKDIWSALFQSLSAFGYEEGQGTTRLSWSNPFLEALKYLHCDAEAS